MASDDHDLGDSQSRAENARFREIAQRQQASNPEYAYAPRWAPMGNWRMSGFDVFIAIAGLGVFAMVLGMWALGMIS
ncbi:hypothetical protein [Plastoroseomonas arctica]|uniref:Uncharacterized protein n=1 Tax=Plastoroseomonas arctica TaxID=1509237 RepID=A0AAF1K4X8_9PROT|nr:hypothetical protein [Plastoroseomonas arctica]MBR0655790.1 hypothetical protein [Plastoroseomonas arctica]